MANARFARRAAAALLAVCFALCAALALAEYPDRPITMIVPYAAGGTTDTYTVSVTALREGSTTVIFQITDPSDTTYSATCAVQVILSAAPPQETDEAAEIG